ncbi:MAG: hypothetical protein QNK26_03125 [Moritella sp.]|nr:hypothetical protein [Moritella sp.]MDX2319571.1 hypothetical protein [Moritella sp.]
MSSKTSFNCQRKITLVAMLCSCALAGNANIRSYMRAIVNHKAKP